MRKDSIMLLRNVYTADDVVIFKLASSYSPSSTGIVSQRSAWATKANEIKALRNKIDVQ